MPSICYQISNENILQEFVNRELARILRLENAGLAHKAKELCDDGFQTEKVAALMGTAWESVEDVEVLEKEVFASLKECL